MSFSPCLLFCSPWKHICCYASVMLVCYGGFEVWPEIVMSPVFQYCSFCLGLLWLSGIFCSSKWIFGLIFFPLFVKIVIRIWNCRLFLVMWAFYYINPANTWTQKFLCSSVFFSFFGVLKFSLQRALTSCFGLFLGILFFIKAIGNGIVFLVSLFGMFIIGVCRIYWILFIFVCCYFA